MFEYFKKCNLISFKIFKIVNILEISINIIENLENRKKKKILSTSAVISFFSQYFIIKKFKERNVEKKFYNESQYTVTQILSLIFCCACVFTHPSSCPLVHFFFIYILKKITDISTLSANSVACISLTRIQQFFIFLSFEVKFTYI